MKKDTNKDYIMIPNSLLLCDEKTIDAYYWLIYNENKFGNTNFSVDLLLYQSSIPKNNNLRYKRYIRDLFNLKSFYGVTTINISELYEYNDKNQKCNYTKIYTNEYDTIADIQLFKQFLYIARHINNETMYMGHSIKQISDAIGYSKNTITEYNKRLKELGVIDYVNTNYYSNNNGYHLNYTNFYTLSHRVVNTQDVLDKAILYYDKSMGNLGLKKDASKTSYSDIKRSNGIIGYYSKLDIQSLNKKQKEKYSNALQSKLDYFITDWADNPRELFIQSLLENRYSKFNFTYDVCEQLIDGKLKIIDAIEIYGECESQII